MLDTGCWMRDKMAKCQNGDIYMKHILFLISVFCCPFILLAQWYPVPVPTTQGLGSITFTDPLHGFCPLGNGSILESSDGGINWQIVPTGYLSILTDICFPTASTGYSVGNDGTVVKTVNAGNTWSVINSPTSNVLRGVFFFNPDTGFICGQQESIYKTTNGGTTWIQQTSGSYWLRKFSFPTPQTGYCVGDNLLIFKTINGGLTWNQQPGSGGSNLTGVQFLTTDTGYVCGYNGYVAKSINGGLTWQILNTGTTTDFEGLLFLSLLEGYCVGTPGIIMHTVDGGITWTQETSGTSVTLERLYFFNQYQGFICGGVGTLLENCLPATGSITGPNPVCQGDAGKIYSVNAVAGATGYHWSVPPGVIITSGSNTNIITVTFTATSSSGSFSVYAFTSSCNGTISPSFPVIVNPLPSPTITGPSAICAATPGNVYTTESGMTNYSWTVSSGGIITAGGTSTSNTATVTWIAPGAQTVSVNYSNAFGCAAINATIFNVTVNPLPIPSLAGPVSSCIGSTYNVYITQPGMINYSWNVSAGGTITAGGNSTSNTVTVTWNTIGSQTVSVNYTDGNGCTGAAPALVNVNVYPLPVPTLAGPEYPCVGSTGNIYSTDTGMSNYIWNVSSGGIITAGGTSSSSTTTVTWTSTGTQNVSVNYTDTNGCTATNPTVFTVNVEALPVPTIMGPDSVCILSTGNNYSTETGMLFYIWTVSSGGTITSGWGTNSITVTWNSAGPQQVTVIYTNQFGCTAANPTSFNVTVKPLPGSPGNITGPSPVCAGSTGLVYTVSPVSSAISYVWILPSGFSIVSGNGTDSITVTVDANASSGNILVYATNNCGNGAFSPPFPVTINYPATGNAGPDGLTCQTNPFTITQASASNYSTIHWYSSGTGTLSGSTTLSPTYTPAEGETGPVTLTMIIYGNAPCGNDTSKMTLEIEPKAMVNAGNDLVTCGQNPVIISGSSASDYQFLLWTTTGSGIFNDPTILHPTYTPGTSDINAGSVFLTLHATSVSPCEPDSNRVLLTISNPVYANTGPDTSVCEDQPFSLSKAIANSYSAITWSTSGDGTFNDPNIINPIYIPGTGDILQGKTLLIMTAEGVSPCPPNSDSLLLTINRKPSVHPGPDGVICQGMTYPVVGVTAFDYSHFTWQSNGQGVLSDTTTLSPVYTPGPDETGTVTLVLKVFGDLACHDSMVSCRINVIIYSAVTAEAGADQTIAYNAMATLQAAASGGSGNYLYEWQPPSLVQNDTAREVQTLPLKNDTIFIVTVTDKITGCIASDSIHIHVGPGEGLDSCIVVHNVITPNGDGLNDTWIIDCIENFPDNSVQIFNRWGDVVNSFDRYDNTTYVWKGTNKNGKLLPDGTYYYVLQIKNLKTRTGWVLLRGGLN